MIEFALISLEKGYGEHKLQARPCDEVGQIRSRTETNSQSPEARKVKVGHHR